LTLLEFYRRRLACCALFSVRLTDRGAVFTVRIGGQSFIEEPFLMMPATDPQDELLYAVCRPFPSAVPKCRRCGHCRANRPRGLCWSCFYTPGVREQYPPTGPSGRRGVGYQHNSLPRPLPALPTTAAPGTPEKVTVLEERALQGVGLFHPADARFPGDLRPLLFIRLSA